MIKTSREVNILSYKSSNSHKHQSQSTNSIKTLSQMDPKSTAEVDYKTLYNSLKRKFTDLEDVKNQLDQAKREIKKLGKEKRYLLDKLIQFEDVSSDSESEGDYNLSNRKSHNSSSNSSSNNIKEKTPRKYTDQGNNSNIRTVTAPVSDTSSLICIGKDNKACKGKSLPGSIYCWHHAPLDPNTDFIYCKYVSSNKKNNKKCNIPISKSKANPYCNYHQSKAMGLTDVPAPTTPPNNINTTNINQQSQTIVKNIPQSPPQQPQPQPQQHSLPSSQNNTPPPSEQLSPKQHSTFDNPSKKIKLDNANTIVSFQNVGNPEIPLPSISQTPSSHKITMSATISGFKQNIQPLSPPQQQQGQQQQGHQINLIKVNESPSKIQMSLSPQSKITLQTPISPSLMNNSKIILNQVQNEDIDIEGDN